MENRVFENQYMRMEILDGILHTHYKKGISITLDIAIKCVDQKMKILDGNEYPVIVYDEGILSIDKASRDYFASDKGTQGLTASAFIKKSIFSKILIDFFLRISSPKIKSRAFTNVDEAIEWIRGLEKK
jgi:hypothetical protein